MIRSASNEALKLADQVSEHLEALVQRQSAGLAEQQERGHHAP